VGQVRDGRGGDDTDVDDVDTGAREAGADGGREELARGAGVTAHDGLRAVAREHTALPEHVRCCDREVESDLGRDVTVREPAHTVCSEDTSHLLVHPCEKREITAAGLRSPPVERRTAPMGSPSGPSQSAKDQRLEY